jgi:hypothetical protein
MIAEFLEDTPWLTVAIVALLVPVAIAATLFSCQLLHEQRLDAMGILHGVWSFLRTNRYVQVAIFSAIGVAFLAGFKEFPDWYYMPAWSYPVAAMPLIAIVLRWSSPMPWRYVSIVTASVALVLTAGIASNKGLETDRRTYGRKLGEVSRYDWFKYMFTAPEAGKELFADPRYHDLGDGERFLVVGFDGFEGIAVKTYLEWEAGRDLTREETRAAGKEFFQRFTGESPDSYYMLFKLIRIGFLSGVNPGEARRVFDRDWEERLPDAKRQEAYQALERHFQHKRESQETAQGGAIIDDLTASKYFRELQTLQPGQDPERQAFLFAVLYRYARAREGLESK